MSWVLLSQSTHSLTPCPQAKALLIDAHAGIDAALKEMHAAFEPDGEEVQREWVRFTQRVDKKLEDALRATVKRSLQALSRMLNGDSKTEVLPLFRVTMVLERNARVELRPTVQQLFDTVHKVCGRDAHGWGLDARGWGLERLGSGAKTCWIGLQLVAGHPLLQPQLSSHVCHLSCPQAHNALWPASLQLQVSRDLITVLQFVPRVSRPPTERQRREAEERGEVSSRWHGRNARTAIGSLLRLCASRAICGAARCLC